MIALATALLLIVPIGVFADPMSDVVTTGGKVVAEVKDVHLLGTAYNFTPVPTTLHKQEELVEGHTVFVTLENIGNATPMIENITGNGFVQCDTHYEITKSWVNVLGQWVPYPTDVNDVYAECSFGSTVIITPSVYCDLENDPRCGVDDSAPTMRPDGNYYPFTTPDGQSGYVKEYAFQLEDGAGGARTYYAWATPILHPWIDATDGTAQNIQFELPADKLDEMGLDHFFVMYQDAVKTSDASR
jgi:hypothetical protein